MLKLGFHYHVPARCDDHGEIFMPGPVGRFVDSLAEQCAGVTCFMHEPVAGESPGDHRIVSRRVELVSLGPHLSVPRRVLGGRRIVAPVLRYREQLDAMLIRGPSPLLAQVADAARPARTVLLLVGDYLKGVGALPQPRWRLAAIWAWSWLNKRGQDRIAARSLVFVNSRLLLEEYRSKAAKVVETRTTTLKADEIVIRDDACSTPPFRVLYVGRLDASKGLLDIAEAIRILRGSGHDVVFDLVGAPERNDDILDRLTAFGAAHGVPTHYHGFKSLGPDLFACFEQADVHVIASQRSEGFPRTIWEAFARGLPVVATRVGSIPFTVEDGRHALLVPPERPPELAAAIARLITDQDLVAKMVEAARALVMENTLDRRAAEMVEGINRWIADG